MLSIQNLPPSRKKAQTNHWEIQTIWSLILDNQKLPARNKLNLLMLNVYKDLKAWENFTISSIKKCIKSETSHSAQI